MHFQFSIPITVMRLIALLMTNPLAIARQQCFNLEQELAFCARKYKVQIPPNLLYGYSFGYGSLNDTEYMCRTRWHILVFQCMRKRSEEACRNTEEEKFRQLIWSISLETKKFERAANYICHEHNLGILREHQFKCLSLKEKEAEQCTIHKSDTVREVVTALQNQSNRLPSGSTEYYTIIKETLTRYECKTLQTKLECLYTVLYKVCPANAVRLIMNYFKETLPDDCNFSYENRLLEYIGSSTILPQFEKGLASSSSFPSSKAQTVQDNTRFRKSTSSVKNTSSQQIFLIFYSILTVSIVVCVL
ncbi:hypothetical protein FGIG_02374 [Fasciola gigantica]|uniref:Golgi apparatus protein 1 n=1 Tax=Fasciola gigantica TaxID=46835 RepID=A0A504YXP7_FASGI|nr:hypothetical protein FGIG_02374 [Fasciola gigantica]